MKPWQVHTPSKRATFWFYILGWCVLAGYFLFATAQAAAPRCENYFAQADSAFANPKFK